MKKLILSLGLLMIQSFFATAVFGQNDPCAGFPNNPELRNKGMKLITMEVAAPGGTSPHMTAMILNDPLNKFFAQRTDPANPGKKLDVRLVIETNGQDSGAVAAQRVKGANPDGSTLLLASTSVLAVNPYLKGVGNKNYNASDFKPVSYVSSEPFFLACNAKKFPPGTTVDQFVEKVGKDYTFYGVSSGFANMPRLSMDRLIQVAGISEKNMQASPYTSPPQMVGDLRQGDAVDCAFVSRTTAASFFEKNGSTPVTVIANTSDRPVEGLDKSRPIPPISSSEKAAKYGNFVPFYGVYGPKGMNEKDAECLGYAIQSVLADPDIRQRLEARGVTTDPSIDRDRLQSMVHASLPGTPEPSVWKEALANANRNLSRIYNGTQETASSSAPGAER
jgi:tripartite-type tricarboxylate transporter receptor subunit TctC